MISITPVTLKKITFSIVLIVFSNTSLLAADDVKNLTGSFPSPALSQQESVETPLEGKTSDYETFHDIDDTSIKVPKKVPYVIQVSVPGNLYGDLSFYGSVGFAFSVFNSLKIDGDYHIPAFLFTVTVACLFLDFLVKRSHLNYIERVQKLGIMEEK